MTLTRSQAANRLGRSIATVRKLEEIGYLSPRFGERGRRLFDADQVAAVAQRSDQTGRALPESSKQAPGLSSAAPPTGDLLGQVAELKARNQVLRVELKEVRASVIELVDELLGVIGRRNLRALDALERLLAIASKR